jgi:hypothetical protein
MRNLQRDLLMVYSHPGRGELVFSPADSMLQE